MKNKITEKLINIWTKLKKSRRLQIMLLIVFVLVVIVCYFSFSTKSEKTKTDLETNENSSYINYLESKLKTALISLEGVDCVNVTITLENGYERIYATEQQTKTTTSGTITTSSLVIISGEPVLVKEIYPKVKGVVVVSSSAKDIGVRMNILYAIQTILEISNDQITILY